MRLNSKSLYHIYSAQTTYFHFYIDYIFSILFWRSHFQFAVPVEGEHAACDRHVHWHLSRHPANHKHLLSCVRVEGGVVDVLGSPELILCQARLCGAGSETIKTVKWCSVFSLHLKQQQSHKHVRTIQTAHPRYPFLLTVCEINLSTKNIIWTDF